MQTSVVIATFIALPDQPPARPFAYLHPQAMAKLLTTLTDYAADY